MKLITLLTNGEKIYFNETRGLTWSIVTPGARDDFTSYLYFDSRLQLFYEYEKETNSIMYTPFHRVQMILQMIEAEQKNVNQLLSEQK